LIEISIPSLLRQAKTLSLIYVFCIDIASISTASSSSRDLAHFFSSQLFRIVYSSQICL